MYEEAVKSRIDRRPTPAIFILDEGPLIHLREKPLMMTQLTS